MTKTDKALVLLLRFVGVGSLFALVAVFMPVPWMAATHRWLGLGEMPTGPVVEYLARSLSAFYALVGALCLVVLPAPGAVPGGGLRPAERGPARRRSGGGDAVVVVGLRGARGRGVRGAAVRAGPLIERVALVMLNSFGHLTPCFHLEVETLGPVRGMTRWQQFFNLSPRCRLACSPGLLSTSPG